jgi:hypothetical protein
VARLTCKRAFGDAERRDEAEAHTDAGLVETITGIQRRVYEDSGHAMRGVHAKAYGVLVGELRVLDGLPRILAQGLVYARAASYRAGQHRCCAALVNAGRRPSQLLSNDTMTEISRTHCHI